MHACLSETDRELIDEYYLRTGKIQSTRYAIQKNGITSSNIALLILTLFPEVDIQEQQEGESLIFPDLY